MSNPPYDQNNPNQWNQQVPPNYTQQVPPGGYQQMPPQGGYQQYPPQGAYGMQEKLPNSGGILTLGILGIVLAGGIGIILSIIAIAMASGAINTYNQNPGRYTEQSLSRVKAGRTCAIIGLCLFVVVILLVIAANS
ncbi:MAG TPA: hypothetical protein VFJ43_03835 [Bacteroidia bacterium]|nr:hypothetical protein [Bacteroidia bacterium]